MQSKFIHQLPMPALSTRAKILVLSVVFWAQFETVLAKTLDGKTMTLTIPDEAVVTNEVNDTPHKLDAYGWEFLRADGGGMFGLRPLETHGLPKEKLLLLAQEQLAREKKQYASIGFDKGRTWSPITPVSFSNRGWTGLAYHVDSVLVLKTRSIKSTEYRMVLWGGGKAWFCSCISDDKGHARFIKVLESAAFKAIPAGTTDTELEIQLPPQEVRTWTNALGRTFEGKLVSAPSGGLYVCFEREGHVFAPMPLSMLSKEDQKYLRTLIEASTKEVPVDKKKTP